MEEIKRVVFDIETVPFSDEFRKAESPQRRLHLAPPMRLACLFDEQSQAYTFYTPETATELVERLQQADEVISFNGKKFDILVLRKHYGLRGKLPIKGKHIDLHQIISEKAGFRVSLEMAAQWNLGEKKHTKGRKMIEVDGEKLKEACQSDVSQTYRLWQLHAQNQLQIRQRSYISFTSDIETGPGHHMPNICPCCLDEGTLEFSDYSMSEVDDMTEGQWAEYMAGTHGAAICRTCNSFIDWEM